MATWKQNHKRILQKQQSADALLKRAQQQAAEPLYDKRNRNQLFADAANTMLRIGTVLAQRPENQALVMGPGADGKTRMSTKGLSFGRLLSNGIAKYLKKTTEEKENAARQLNSACRILMEHPDTTIQKAASNLLGYIHLKETTNTGALKLAVRDLNQAVKASTRSHKFLSRT